MLYVSTIKEDIDARIQDLKQAKASLEKELKHSPPGKIHVVRSGNRVQFYLRKQPSDKSGEYLSQNKDRTIRIYLRKSYNERALKIIEKEMNQLERFRSSYLDSSPQLRDLYASALDQVKRYLNPIDISDDEFVEIWKQTPFVPKQMTNMKMCYITNRGEQVRSKSELLIANMLDRMEIPYKYECPLELTKKRIVYPDFTVLNPRSRAVYYWEHRGMMDDRDYARHSVDRIKDYGKAGIYPGKGLIITEETLSMPLASQEVINIINAYLK